MPGIAGGDRCWGRPREERSGRHLGRYQDLLEGPGGKYPTAVRWVSSQWHLGKLRGTQKSQKGHFLLEERRGDAGDEEESPQP